MASKYDLTSLAVAVVFEAALPDVADPLILLKKLQSGRRLSP